MDSDQKIFALIGGITVAILAVIILTSSTGGNADLTPEYIIGDNPHIKGSDNPELVLVEFSDFECPFCAKYGFIVDDLVRKYPTKLAHVYRHFPLVNIHTRAIATAQASEAAANQGQFWSYHDDIFANQPSFSDDELILYADNLGLDIERFNADRNSDEVTAKVQEDAQIASELQLSGTPSYFLVYDGKVEAVVLAGDGDLEAAVFEVLGDPEISIEDEDDASKEIGDSEPEESIDDSQQQATIEVISDLVNTQVQDVHPSDVKVVSVEAKQWSDSALGCAESMPDDMMFAQVITPGYEIVLEAEGSTYVYHTDMNGSLVLCTIDGEFVGSRDI